MATDRERAIWLDGYEDAIRHIYPTADAESDILDEFMGRARERVDNEIDRARAWFDSLEDRGYGRGREGDRTTCSQG